MQNLVGMRGALELGRTDKASSVPSDGSSGMAKKKVADLLVDVLAEAGVQNIYGVSGDSLNGITDSIRARKQIQWIHVVEGQSDLCGRSAI
jgi:Thiamine pyrophosphate enzyme, N-terminal TPP binding domain